MIDSIIGQDVTLSAACAPPGGGRNPVTPRFIRHFSMFSIPSSADFTLKTIFTSICKGCYNSHEYTYIIPII